MGGACDCGTAFESSHLPGSSNHLKLFRRELKLLDELVLGVGLADEPGPLGEYEVEGFREGRVKSGLELLRDFVCEEEVELGWLFIELFFQKAALGSAMPLDLFL